MPDRHCDYVSAYLPKQSQYPPEKIGPRPDRPPTPPAISEDGPAYAYRTGFPAALRARYWAVMDPRRNSQRSGPGEAEGGGLELRETSPRSPTPGLPVPPRLKRGARPWVSGASAAVRACRGSTGGLSVQVSVLYSNSPFPMMTNIMARIPRMKPPPMSAQIDPASANPQILLLRAKIPPTMAIIPNMIAGVPMAPNHPIAKNPPTRPPIRVAAIPNIALVAPPTMLSMPAAVGFQVLSISIPPFSFSMYSSRTYSCAGIILLPWSVVNSFYVDSAHRC